MPILAMTDKRLEAEMNCTGTRKTQTRVCDMAASASATPGQDRAKPRSVAVRLAAACEAACKR